MSALEEWRPIPGYEGLYDVSSLGRVRSWSRVKRGGLLALRPNEQGYLSAGLARCGHLKLRKVHQLVLEAFVEPRPVGHVARHLDGNLLNNALDNLAWGTQSENMADCLRHGTHPEARKTHCPAGHEYTPENTVVRVNGKRRCRACQRVRGGYKGGLPMHDRTHCPSGHEYSPENTRIRASDGARVCRACIRERGETRRRRGDH